VKGNNMTAFYEHHHLVAGELRFELNNPETSVRFFCDWPYDLEANEWICFDAEFPVRVFRKRLGVLSRTNPVVVPGRAGSKIQFTMLSSGTIEIDVCDGCHHTFRYPIPATPKCLRPSKNGRVVA